MADAERLADYLAGELSADERAALVAELSRDPALRARLEAMRTADEALAGAATIEPPAGFDDRVHAAVATELERLVEAEGSNVVPLHGRRRGWIPAVAAAAAGILVVAGIGLATSRSLDTPDDTLMADDDQTVESLVAPDEAGHPPAIVDVGRQVGETELMELLELPELVMLADEALGQPQAHALAQEWISMFAQSDAARAEAPEALQAPSAEADAPSVEPHAERTESADEPMVTRCLAAIDPDRTLPLPVYAELAFDPNGSPVIVYGLVVLDPETGAYTGREVVMVAQEDCSIIGRVEAS